jgi:hypothetical protein
MTAQLYRRLVTAVRLLMGADLVVNGLNWWVKLVTPYPSISDFAERPPPPDFIGAMISTGVIFHVVKGLELVAGIALLANRFVPLALVAVFAVTINVFLVDVFLAQRFRAYVMGIGELLMNLALLLAYLDHYRPMLRMRAAPDAHGESSAELPAVLRSLVAVRVPLLLVAGLFGVVMIVWVVAMIVQRQLQQ